MTGPSSFEVIDLTVFLAVARTGSFGRAAVELQVAQPSVSARMAALERKLDTRLFTRGPRGTVLTTAGERLGDFARRCLDLLAETEAAVKAEGVDRIVVAAPASLGGVVFPALLQAISGKAVDIVCRVAHSDEAIAAVLDGSAHAAFVLRRVLPAGLHPLLLGSSPIVAVASPHHPLVRLEHPHITDLVSTAVILHNWSEDARDLAAALASPRRGRHHPVRLVGTPDIAVDLATRSDYVAVVPLYAAARSLRLGDLCQLSLPNLSWEQQIRLVHRAEVSDRPGITLLMSALDRVVDSLETGSP